MTQTTAPRRSAPFSIYCDWGMHDELGDTVELDAAMAHRALDTLERWQRDHGVRFDYYLIDCFWFDPELGYEHFKRSHWPEGFEPVRRRILDLGMKPGLWYSTNGWQLNPPQWADSASGVMYSLIDGGYAERLEAAWRHAIGAWGVRLLKLDFGAFTISAEGTSRPAQEAYRQSVRRLKEILRRVRADTPDLRVIAHCGYARAEHGRDPLGRHAPGNDPSWLEVIDHLFSGDPSPAHTPRTTVPRAGDLFQDQQVYRVHRDGLPLHRIEDHGVMIGTTNTCLYRGRAGFRRSHLGQLARGGRRDMFYGDPSLLTDDDVHGLRKTRELFFEAFAAGLETSVVGPGEPGLVPWHGYLTGGGDAGLLYLVNGTLLPQTAELVLPGLFEAAVLFDDGPAPAVQVQPDRLRVTLAPEQVTLLGLGRYASPDLHVGGSDDPPAADARLVPATLKPTPAGVRADLPEPTGDDELLVVVRLLDAVKRQPLLAPPHVVAKENSKDGRRDGSALQRLVQVHVTDAAGQPVRARNVVPNKPMWAGISWTIHRFPWTSRGSVRIEVDLEHRFVVELLGRRASGSPSA